MHLHQKWKCITVVHIHFPASLCIFPLISPSLFFIRLRIGLIRLETAWRWARDIPGLEGESERDYACINEGIKGGLSHHRRGQIFPLRDK